jgi:hypothetical protein
MWPSASARAAARSAPSSSAIAFPVDAATRRTRDIHASATPCCTGAPAGEPARRAGSGGRALRSPPADRRGSGRPTSSRYAGRSPLPSVEAVHRERKRRGRLVARLAGHAAHQGVEDRPVVAGVHAAGCLGREPREHSVGALDVTAREVALERPAERPVPVRSQPSSTDWMYTPVPPTTTGTTSSDAASDTSSSRAICAYASSDSLDDGSATSSRRCPNPRICDGLILLMPMSMPA